MCCCWGRTGARPLTLPPQQSTVSHVRWAGQGLSVTGPRPAHGGCCWEAAAVARSQARTCGAAVLQRSALQCLRCSQAVAVAGLSGSPRQPRSSVDRQRSHRSRACAVCELCVCVWSLPCWWYRPAPWYSFATNRRRPRRGSWRSGVTREEGGGATRSQPCLEPGPPKHGGRLPWEQSRCSLSSCVGYTSPRAPAPCTAILQLAGTLHTPAATLTDLCATGTHTGPPTRPTHTSTPPQTHHIALGD